jgi:methylenetetrahydrofolate dehydrogenase (NADP+)/methenyltetrahydrofolate cyclohydrolase
MLKATVMDGKQTASDLLDQLKATVDEQSLSPQLHVVLVGDDEASLSYIRQKTSSADDVGIDTEVHQFPTDVEVGTVRDRIESLNRDEDVDGIIVQLPLPDRFDKVEILSTVDPVKDVDGLNPVNFGCLLGGGEPAFYPPTPRGILRLLDKYDVDVRGMTCAMVGMGRLVGRPLSQMLLNEGATVLCLNEQTEDIREFTRQAELLVAAAGVPELVGKEDVRPGSVVVDAGIHRTDDGLVGDVAYDGVSDTARLITPVPGGVGPLTVACLLQNTVDSARADNS